MKLYKYTGRVTFYCYTVPEEPEPFFDHTPTMQLLVKSDDEDTAPTALHTIGGSKMANLLLTLINDKGFVGDVEWTFYYDGDMQLLAVEIPSAYEDTYIPAAGYVVVSKTGLQGFGQLNSKTEPAPMSGEDYLGYLAFLHTVKS